MMRACERLLKYVVVHTTSDEKSGLVPSTHRQFDLAGLLAEEMREIGISDVRVDDKCYVYGSIPATPGLEDRPVLGFISHMDTAPVFCGEGVKPLIWENYDGGEVVLPGGIVLSPDMFPHLPGLKGRTLITSDGTTLLGADDKAGIAEILTMAERVIREGLPHGKISIAFTPDEEIGSGAEYLDLKAFGADFGYTVDGGAENEIEYENFNAAQAVFEIRGLSVHPGEAKGKMINAALLAVRIAGMLPQAETPALTEGREGFFHLTSISGDVERASLAYIVRDHSASRFEARLETLRHIGKILNEEYPVGGGALPEEGDRASAEDAGAVRTVTLNIREQYRNMIDKIRPHMHLVETACEVMRQLGLDPVMPPVRGGTDGALLSFRGLPCPNLGTGGSAFHGPYEHITAEGMDTVVEVLLGIVGKYADKGRNYG